MQEQLRPPGSKSLSNRALLLAAMAEGTTVIRGLLDAEDTRVMLDALERLGVSVSTEGEALADGVIVEGAGRRLGSSTGAISLHVGTAGTVARFLTAAVAAASEPTWESVLIDGTPRMRERPMDTLLEALVELGSEIEALGKPGALPCRVHARSGLDGGTLYFGKLESSQFVSALALTGAWTREPLRLVLLEGTPARPYVDMSLTTLACFGGQGRWVSPEPERGETGEVIEVLPVADLRAPEEPFVIEPDASAASYLLALPAIWGGQVTIPDLGSTSVQGDARFFEVLGRFGAQVEQTATTTRVRGTGRLVGLDLDLSDMPDTALTAAVVALFADGPTRLRGVEVLRHHESDRLAAAATELRKLGAKVVVRDDGLEIHPPAGGPRRGVEIDTYADHRMAMAFALVGSVTIRDPGCVAKTFPGYFSLLDELGMVVHEGPT